MFCAALLRFTMPLLISIHIFIYFVPDAFPLALLFFCLRIFLFSVEKKKSRFNVTKCEWKTEKPVNFTTHAFTYPPSESEKFCPAHFFFSVKEDEFSSRS